MVSDDFGSLIPSPYDVQSLRVGLVCTGVLGISTTVPHAGAGLSKTQFPAIG